MLGISILIGLVMATVAALVFVHGTLSSRMEARGVKPWTLKDSVGASPLVLAGAADIGGGVGWAIALFIDSVRPIPMMKLFGAIMLAGTGVVMIALGVLAWRKLS